MDDRIDQKIKQIFYDTPIIQPKKNSIIINAQEEPENIYYITSGYIRMYTLSLDGKELTVNIFKPGTYFPGAWAIANISNNFFYETMTKARISYLPKAEFIDWIEKEPDVLYDLTKRIISGLNATLMRMNYLMSSDAQSRVAASLLMLANRFGKEKSNEEIEIQLQCTHKDIAALAGLTRESTSSEISKMKKEGLIKNKNKYMVINNLEKLIHRVSPDIS